MNIPAREGARKAKSGLRDCSSTSRLPKQAAFEAQQILREGRLDMLEVCAPPESGLGQAVEAGRTGDQARQAQRVRSDDEHGLSSSVQDAGTRETKESCVLATVYGQIDHPERQPADAGAVRAPGS